MRQRFGSFTTPALLVAALVLLGSAVVLHQNTGHSYAGRDAFAARFEHSDRPMFPRVIASEWRSEIAALRVLSDRDQMLSRVLFGTGVLVLLALAASRRSTRAVPDAAPTPQ